MPRLQPQDPRPEPEVDYEFVDEFDEMLEWEDDGINAPEVSALTGRANEHGDE